MVTRSAKTMQWALSLSLNLGLIACGSDAGAPPPPAANAADDTSQASSTSSDAAAAETVPKQVSTAKNTSGSNSSATVGNLGSALATSSTPKVKIDPANLTATQINYFLTTPEGAATFQAAIANPQVTQASGVPTNLAAFATADAASIANLLEIPQVAAIIDQVVMAMITQTPALGNTIATVAASMPNATAGTGTGGTAANVTITGAAPNSPTTTTTTNTLGSTLIK